MSKMKVYQKNLQQVHFQNQLPKIDYALLDSYRLLFLRSLLLLL